MTEQAKQDYINYLKDLKNGQTFTIEHIVRTIGEKNGEPFTVFEVQHYEDIEKYLVEEGLIKDTEKTTKLYIADSKVKTL